jgi:AcrR family transcriptional regulator
VRLDPTVRRARLLDVAERMLATTDPSKVTLQHLADAAGVSRPLVYAYFQDRAGLLAAVDRQRAATVDEALAKAAAAVGVTDPVALASALATAADELGFRARAPFVADRPDGGCRFPKLAEALGLDPARVDPAAGMVLGAVLANVDLSVDEVAATLATGLGSFLASAASAATVDLRSSSTTDVPVKR